MEGVENWREELKKREQIEHLFHLQEYVTRPSYLNRWTLFVNVREQNVQQGCNPANEVGNPTFPLDIDPMKNSPQTNFF